ncbi:MAG TPA: ECF-type sigma factor [Phycisphaerales bacterium]|nr:ECF-type sigma factor [Phycisphaerales bacterium]HMP35864.1 ECF-type sigma factor [Phycisphaerales bacterium]
MTALLARCDQDPEAAERLLALVYDELRRQAANLLRRERRDHTLQPTALVHEAWMRLGLDRAAPSDRSHFMALASIAMRRVLVGHARSRHRLKRSGGRLRLELGDPSVALPTAATFDSADLLSLEEALSRLAALDPRLVRLVELRWFGGLSVEQCAAVLRAGTATIKRDWALARAWLHRELSR